VLFAFVRGNGDPNLLLHRPVFPAWPMTSAPAVPDHYSYNSDIGHFERFWVDQLPFLLTCGYKLRLRYDPAWVPSWTIPGAKSILAGQCENVFSILVSALDLYRW
jgi:hypothetical protein